MSIKYGLLALLEREPMYGYQLRTEFDATTGSTWPQTSDRCTPRSLASNATDW